MRGNNGSREITLEGVFTEHAVMSFDKQKRLEHIHGKDSWFIDFDSGKITFDNKKTYAIQLLGSESYLVNTWLWGWENKVGEISQDLLVAAKELKNFGEKYKLEAFALGEIQLNGIDGEYLSIISSGIFDADCYFKATYNDGAAFVLIQSEKLRKSNINSAEQIILIFTEFIKEWDINHRQAFASYIQKKKWKIVKSDKNKIISSNGDERIIASFDKIGRLLKIGSG